MRGNIERRGRKSWRLKFDLGTDPATGKRLTRRVTVKGGRKDAEKELSRILHEIGEGVYADPSKLTVGEYLDQWLANVKANVAPKTFERWQEICDKHLKPAFGAAPLKSLAPLTIQTYYTDALASGRRNGKGGLAPRTVHHHHRVLSQALKQAVRWRMIGRNPASDVDAPKVEQAEIQILDHNQVPVLLGATRTTRLHVPAILALNTGMRRGEVLAVRWPDMDLNGASLTVNQSLEQTKAGGLRFKSPKSRSGRRRIALSPLTVDTLRRHKVAQAKERLQLGLGKNDSGLVFTTLEGEPINPRTFSKEFTRIVKRAGLDGVTFHALRHTHLTQLLRDGVNVKVVSSRAGHSSVAITLDLYGHVLPGDQEGAALKVDGAWGKALQD